MSHFSLVLRTLRKQHGLTQQQLADMLQVSKSRINMYERGEREPNFEMLHGLGEFFNVDMNYLLGSTKDGIHFGQQENLLEKLKKKTLEMGMASKEILHATAVYSGKLNGISVPTSGFEKAKINSHKNFFTSLTGLSEKEFRELMIYADSYFTYNEDGKDPIQLDAAHEIADASEQDKIDDEKFFDED